MENYLLEAQAIFGKEISLIHYFSPGRVNLIGEHIDYNGGLVFPAAISLGTHGYFHFRTDNMVCCYSKNFPEDGVIQVGLDDLVYVKNHSWVNYVKGVLLALKSRFPKQINGFDLYVSGTLPTASGLSSSASVELLVSYAINDHYNLGLSRQELALLSQQVENDYMGMHCGIMDQLIIAKGENNKALLMNTATLETEVVSAFFPGYEWLIMNTRYPRKTTDSKYNERRSECEQALKSIQTYRPLHYLCELNPSELNKVNPLLKDEKLQRRVRHVVTEQARTVQSKEFLKNYDVESFAKLLNQSHYSLKHDYEVTGLHLDTLVEYARLYGALGARVTGAGFGGCAIALIPQGKAHEISDLVKQDYEKVTGLHAEFYEVQFVEGVHRVND